jgi:hypothetical protein
MSLGQHRPASVMNAPSSIGRVIHYKAQKFYTMSSCQGPSLITSCVCKPSTSRRRWLRRSWLNYRHTYTNALFCDLLATLCPARSSTCPSPSPFLISPPTALLPTAAMRTRHITTFHPPRRRTPSTPGSHSSSNWGTSSITMLTNTSLLERLFL